MKFEHFALNVPDARAMSRWYVEQLGFKLVRKRDDEPYTHFLGDDTGRVTMELYSNPAAAMPDYAAAHPLLFHVADFTPDARAEQQRSETKGEEQAHRSIRMPVGATGSSRLMALVFTHGAG